MDADPRDARIRELEAENQRQREIIERLMRRIEELERATARQAAPFRRKDKDKKPPDQHKPPGRPPGHPPAMRARPQHIDEHVEVRLDICPQCGGPISNCRRCEQYIEELPVVRPHVTHLTTYAADCPQCGEVRSTHPLQVSTACGAAGTHLGPRALGLAAWLNKRLGLTMRSTCKALEALAGLRLTPGGLSQALDRLADKAQGGFDALIATLRNEEAVHSDETSWWVGGPGYWLWTFASPYTTVYHVDASRGRSVVTDMLGPDFRGVLVSDCLATYENLPYRMHKCYSHHLQAISRAQEEAPSDYLNQLRTCLASAMTLQHLRADLPPPEWAAKRQHLEQQADALLSTPRANPPEERVRKRLLKRQQSLFTFLDDPRLEATNNRAERALRPAVIARKLSCGNKTQRGKRTWEILTSLAATAHQRGQSFVEGFRMYLAVPAVAPVR